MKKNIRYVAIFLSVGRVVPHEAEAILRNKFGDCKDKATLMTALLAAKGIASEAALINLGNAYALPEPPTLAALNHVILYLPEFDIYDDPTASGAAFGVLAPEAYDKPVVRVSAAGATLARTPAMKPDDHTAHATTSVKLAADGTVTGQTQESNTGVLGMALRFVGGVGAAGRRRNRGSAPAPEPQHARRRPLRTRQLDGDRRPGRHQGHVLAEQSIRRRPRAASRPIPVGIPLTLRPGNFLLGTRLSGRQSAFVCYAGTQIEDIEATFEPALPLPIPLPPPASTTRASPIGRPSRSRIGH